MSESLHAFWYRPFWQQTIPIWLFISLFLFAGYFSYWKENEILRLELESENNSLIEKITKETRQLQHFPPLHLLEQQADVLKQIVDAKGEPLELLSQLNTLLNHSTVILNQLQPTNSHGYFLEVQGDFISVYRFIEQLLTLPNTQRYRYSDIKLTSKQGAILASVIFSSINHTFAIKDDNSNE